MPSDTAAVNPERSNDAELGAEEREFVLELLFSHRMGWIQDFLRQRKLTLSGTKEDLRDRVDQYLQEGGVAASDLVALLDRVEGWGNQHIYLYKANDELVAALSDEKAVKRRLKNSGLEGLFNRRVPLILPDEPTLSAVEWTADRMRFVWIEKRIYRDRIPDEDREENDLEFDAYKVKQTRGIVAFSCDLVSGHAELLIQRLPSGSNYVEQKTRFEEQLENFIDLNALASFPVSGGIKKIDEANHIRKRSSELATARGDRATFTSRSKKEDVYDNPEIRKARKALGNRAAGRLGNFYWPMDEDSREVHVKLYAKDQRVGIFGECTEQEVRYVLSEVRGYCK